MIAVNDPSSGGWDNWLGVGIAALIVLYIIGVLVFPEKF